jgi:N-acetylglutamate synthase-like GNAT family acetyltransferase
MKNAIIHISDKKVDDVKTIDLNIILEQKGHNPEVIGVCNIFYPDTTPVIMNVHINPTYRRKGLCTRLMNKVYEVLKHRGMDQVFLFVTDENTIKDFYIKSGFKPTKGLVETIGKTWLRKKLL